MEILAKNEKHKVWLGVDWDGVFYISTESENGTWYPIGMNEEEAKKIFEQKIEWNKLKDIMHNADKIEFENDEESLQYWSELSELVTLSYNE